MRNKHKISSNFLELMKEVENPKRPPSKWWGEVEYDWKHYEELLDEVFYEIEEMASRYGITLDEAWFRNHVEYIAISVRSNSPQKKFLKGLISLGNKLKKELQGNIKIQIGRRKIPDNAKLREGVLIGLGLELEDFVKREREKNIYVDGILIDKIKKYLQGEEVEYPKGFLPDGKPYYKDIEDYLYSSVDFSYLEYDKKLAAQSLAYVVLGKDGKGGWKLSVKEGAFLYDLMHYTGFVAEESWEDKNHRGVTTNNKDKYDIAKYYLMGEK